MARKGAASSSVSDETGKELVRISDGLFSDKRRWDQLNQELAENFYPMRADWTRDLNLGEDFALDLMDSYPVQARGQLGDMISAMLRQGLWFEVSTGDEDRDKKPAIAKALARVTMLLRAIILDPRSNVETAMKESDHDWVTFGASVRSWQESMDRSFPILVPHHPRDCVWAVGADQKIDTVHRKLHKSAREIMRRVNSGRWKGTPHHDIKVAADREPHKMFELRHCVMPTDEVYGSDRKMRAAVASEWTSLYYDVEHESTFSARGTPFFNYQVSRYRTLGTWPWGFSPVALQTLPDGRMSQALAGMVLEQGEKALDPPIVGAGDVFRDFNLMSGGFTTADLSEGQKLQDVLTVLDTAKNTNVGFEMRQDMRSLIAEGFLLNKLTLPNTREMTATESGIRLDEFRRAALPFFSPIESEHHAPMLDGALEMAVNLRAIDPSELPEDLHGTQVRYRFRTPLNEAEGQKAIAAFQQMTANVGAAMNIDASIKDMFDWAQAAIDAVQGAGPAAVRWVRDEKEVEARKEQNKKMADLQTAGAAVQQGAAVAADTSAAAIAAQQAAAAGAAA